MSKIRLYKIDLEYIKYLHMNYDSRVQYHSGKSDEYNSNRPYIGVVLNIDNMDYFAPLEHPRPEHMKIKSNTHIVKIKNGRYGLIALNNMIPVHKSLLIDFDINKEKNRAVLITQYQFFNNNKSDIYNRANEVYNKRINKPNDFILKVYCDFKKLEDGLKTYCEEHDIE
jgi:hypothetical protein